MSTNLETIQDTVNLATVYYGELVQELREDLIEGCDCNCGSKLICLQGCINALQYDINTEVNTIRTTRVYKVLQEIIAGFSGAFNADPTVVIPNTTIIAGSGTIFQTPVVYPTDGATSYTFSQLVGAEPLTVYRGTGTTLRVHTSAPDNDFVQINELTGELTFLNPFSTGEGLWVEYRTV